jgi:hypothetical protein
MRSWLLTAVAFAGLMIFGSPAEAGRTVIDQRPLLDPVTGEFVYDEDGNQLFQPLRASVGGYCDFNGEDCDPSGGVSLGYTATIGDTDFGKIFVQGNGLITFGEPVDFQQSPVFDQIDAGDDPLLTDYARTLVSAGQSNSLDFGGVFFQSAIASVDGVTGTITTKFFVCGAPTAPGVCNEGGVYFVTLTPSSDGYLGLFQGGPQGNDRGFVIDGQFTPVTGNSFLLPATFQGLTLGSAVPEPSTWAMMLVGFGAVGYSMRRRKLSYGPAQAV